MAVTTPLFLESLEWMPRHDRVYLVIDDLEKHVGWGEHSIIHDDTDIGQRHALGLHARIRHWCIENLKGRSEERPSAFVRRHRERDLARDTILVRYSIEFVTEKDAILFKLFWL